MLMLKLLNYRAKSFVKQSKGLKEKPNFFNLASFYLRK